MDDSFDMTLLHTDLSELEVLRDYTFDSKMLMSQHISSRIMNGSAVDMERAYRENIMPWELEIFTAYSVLYNDDSAVKDLDLATFAHLITYIRNYWDKAWTELEASGDYPEAFMIRSAIQQFPVQGVYLQKLFRYSYFFNFQNANLDMKREFSKKFSADYSTFDLSAFAIFLAFSNNEGVRNTSVERVVLLSKVFQSKVLMDALCIDQTDYIEEMQKLYNGDLLKMYYGLKAQYWWPLISGKDYIYVPCPFLIINAVTDSMLNRLTLGNERLRNLIGKEVIEQYLYDLYAQINGVNWISREIEYRGSNGNERTPDVLVAEGSYCTFYDTKEMVPNLKVRELNRNELEKDIEIYATAISKVYHQIQNYLSGMYELNTQYDLQHLFGVIVMLDDIALSRSKIYSKVFEVYSEKYGSLSDDEEKYIHSHIKIISLRQIETLLLENSSFLPCLIEQAANESHWDDLWYSRSTEGNGLLSIYEDYVTDIKGRFVNLIKAQQK